MSLDEENTRRQTVTLHMVSSLDGFIAKKDNSVAWLESAEGVYENGVSISPKEIAAFIKSVNCCVMGSHTYEHALQLGWVYGDTPVVVVSSRELTPGERRGLFRRSQNFGQLETCAALSEHMARRRSHVVPAFPRAWLGG